MAETYKYDLQTKRVGAEDDLKKAQYIKFPAHEKTTHKSSLAIRLTKTFSLKELLLDQAREGAHTDIVIAIGKAYFRCHLMVLRSCANYFKNIQVQSPFSLPATEITPQGFELSYSWMLINEHLELNKDDLPHVMKAAQFLQMDGLLEQCWRIFDDTSIYDEPSYLSCYRQAKALNMKHLQNMSLARICRAFLSLVASSQFLRMDVDEVCQLFLLNSIGVQDETQVLLAAVLWLNHNWPMHEKYIAQVLSCVRYYLMPPVILITLRQAVDLELPLERILKMPAAKQLMTDGITLVTLLTTYRNCPHMHILLNDLNVKLAPPRSWLTDADGGIPKYCCNVEWEGEKLKVWQPFQQHLKAIKDKGDGFWKTMVKVVTK